MPPGAASGRAGPATDEAGHTMKRIMHVTACYLANLIRERPELSQLALGMDAEEALKRLEEMPADQVISCGRPGCPDCPGSDPTPEPHHNNEEEITA